MPGAFLERWLEEVLAGPGLTGIGDSEEGRRVLLEDSLRAAPIVAANPGAVIDVGSGGGAPGIPLAVSLPERSFTLLEARRRKCDFLAKVTSELENVTVIRGRAEDQPREGYGVALAKALAKPPVAVELCLPLVRPGGIAVVWVGESAEVGRMARVAELLVATLEESHQGLVVLRKVGRTPAGFPRRAGMARKRPL